MTEFLKGKAAVLPDRLETHSTVTPAEARAILRIDEKWSVEYQPDSNDAPGRVLRYGEPAFGGSSDWKNDTRAMFYALLERDAALEAQAAELAAVKAERDYAVSEMKGARIYRNIETRHAEDAEARAERAEAALAEARKALEPFANACGLDGSLDEDEDPISGYWADIENEGPNAVTFGHFRAARRALTGGQEDG